MNLHVNEKELETDAKTLWQLRQRFSPEADVIICNGFVVTQDRPLFQGDSIHFINKGAVPPKEELESLMAARHTPGVYAKAKQAKVAVAGLGGLGSHIAAALARCGVGNLLLIDYDIVEPSNLNRQYYFIRHLGLAKTQAMEEILREINPYINVKTIPVRLDEKNIALLLNGYEIVVEAFDNPDAKAMLVNTTLSAFPDTKVVCASGMAGYHSANSITTCKLSDRLYLCGDRANEAREGQGLMSPRVMVCAGHQAAIVLRLILGETEA